jgi:hypothetical protein
MLIESVKGRLSHTRLLHDELMISRPGFSSELLAALFLAIPTFFAVSVIEAILRASLAFWATTLILFAAGVMYSSVVTTRRLNTPENVLKTWIAMKEVTRASRRSFFFLNAQIQTGVEWHRRANRLRFLATLIVILGVVLAAGLPRMALALWGPRLSVPVQDGLASLSGLAGEWRAMIAFLGCGVFFQTMAAQMNTWERDYDRLVHEAQVQHHRVETAAVYEAMRRSLDVGPGTMSVLESAIVTTPAAQSTDSGNGGMASNEGGTPSEPLGAFVLGAAKKSLGL